MTNDYISREGALDAFNRAVQDVGILDADDIETVFGMLSPVDVVQVVHGRWIDADFCGQYECSECGNNAVDLYDYCPYCGAKMDA